MDISYSLALEDHARINPLQGLEALAEKIVPRGATRERVPAPREVKAQNEQSMATLNAMLSNVQGAPTRKPRRGKR